MRNASGGNDDPVDIPVIVAGRIGGCVGTNIAVGSSIKSRDARNNVNSAEEHLEGESVLFQLELEAPADQPPILSYAFPIMSPGAVLVEPCFAAMQLPLKLMKTHQLSGKGGAIDVEGQRRHRGEDL